jgi:hypothetical protein
MWLVSLTWFWMFGTPLCCPVRNFGYSSLYPLATGDMHATYSTAMLLIVNIVGLIHNRKRQANVCEENTSPHPVACG